jgi:uncharacterized protein with PhoU and TrkA domain
MKLDFRQSAARREKLPHLRLHRTIAIRNIAIRRVRSWLLGGGYINSDI